MPLAKGAHGALPNGLDRTTHTAPWGARGTSKRGRGQDGGPPSVCWVCTERGGCRTTLQSTGTALPSAQGRHPPGPRAHADLRRRGPARRRLEPHGVSPTRTPWWLHRPEPPLGHQSRGTHGTCETAPRSGARGVTRRGKDVHGRPARCPDGALGPTTRGLSDRTVPRGGGRPRRDLGRERAREARHLPVSRRFPGDPSSTSQSPQVLRDLFLGCRRVSNLGRTTDKKVLVPS